MLTGEASAVDATPRSVMWSITQIAEREGVSKQAISKAVKRLAAHNGLTVERDARGHIKAVNVALYDHLRGQYRDPSKDQRPAPTSANGKAGGKADERVADSLDEASRQRAWLAAERERIALAEDKGKLLRAAGVADALVSAGADIAHILDRGVNATDELAAAVARDGVHGLRVGLKKLFGRMRGDIADALAKVAGEAPPLEPAGDGGETEKAAVAA